MIYTIGYQGLKPDRLRDIVRSLDAVLVDVRSSPRSRIAGFGGNQLRELMGDDAFIAAGPTLGGRAPINAQAVKQLRLRFESPHAHNAVLMCMETNPAQCHRHRDICRPFLPGALHIVDVCLFSVEGIERLRVDDTMPEPVGYLPGA